ncbi:MAG TPA: hypothetical protein V6C97_26960 [Oculatellaceae cyanobacterium]
MHSQPIGWDLRMGTQSHDQHQQAALAKTRGEAYQSERARRKERKSEGKRERGNGPAALKRASFQNLQLEEIT